MKRVLKYLLATSICFSSIAFSKSHFSESNVPEMPDELNVDKLVNYIEQHQVSSVEELLAALPERVRKNFVMMHTSRSLASEITSIDHPRVVLFSPDASLMLAFATNLTDRPDLVSQVEFAQLRVEQGNWEFGILDFKQGQLEKTNPAVCADCHGEPEKARPIWSSYPNWPDTFAQAVNASSYPIKLKSQQFINSKHLHPRMKHLVWNQSANYLPRQQKLDDRKFSSPSMVFGMEMASAQSQAIFTRMKAHPEYLNKRKDIICSSYATGELAKIGVSHFDVRMDLLSSDTPTWWGTWSTGETQIVQILQLLLLNELTKEYPELKSLLKNTENIARYPVEQVHVRKEYMYDDLLDRMHTLFETKGQARQTARETYSMKGRSVIGAGLVFQAKPVVCNFLNNL